LPTLLENEDFLKPSVLESPPPRPSVLESLGLTNYFDGILWPKSLWPNPSKSLAEPLWPNPALAKLPIWYWLCSATYRPKYNQY